MPLKDPVCGMTVTPQSFYHLDQDGRTHYFCGAKCKARFTQHVSTYGNADQLDTTRRNGSLRRVQLRWWLLLVVGLMLLALLYRQLT